MEIVDKTYIYEHCIKFAFILPIYTIAFSSSLCSFWSKRNTVWGCVSSLGGRSGSTFLYLSEKGYLLFPSAFFSSASPYSIPFLELSILKGKLGSKPPAFAIFSSLFICSSSTFIMPVALKGRDNWS